MKIFNLRLLTSNSDDLVRITACNDDTFSFVFFPSTTCLQIEFIIKGHDYAGEKIFQEEEKNMKKIG